MADGGTGTPQGFAVGRGGMAGDHAQEGEARSRQAAPPGNPGRGTGTPPSEGLPPLDIAGILWVAAIDRVPIGGRIEWVKAMEQRVAEINAHRAMIDTERPPESVFEEFREIHGV